MSETAPLFSLSALEAGLSHLTVPRSSPAPSMGAGWGGGDAFGSAARKIILSITPSDFAGRRRCRDAMVAWDMADLMHMHALDGLPQHLPLRRYQLTVFLRARQHGHSPSKMVVSTSQRWTMIALAALAQGVNLVLEPPVHPLV